MSERQITVDLPDYKSPRVIRKIEIANGHVTAKGLAFHAQNQYGCIINAVLITDTREPFNAGHWKSLNLGLAPAAQLQMKFVNRLDSFSYEQLSPRKPFITASQSCLFYICPIQKDGAWKDS